MLYSCLDVLLTMLREPAPRRMREKGEALYPDRIIALKVARTIDLTKMALGKVEWTQ